MELSRKGSPPLVVSPTHGESAKVTEAIREAKRGAGKLGEERSFNRLHNLQWESSDKKRMENYREGQVIQFHQNAQGILRGEIFSVTGRAENGITLVRSSTGREMPLPIKFAERFQVFEEREISVGKGEQIRITRNGKSANDRRLNNGNVFTVEKFKKNGNIVLSNGVELDRNHGHFTYGYCQTSHSSQSKSVRDVLVAQSEDSFVASSREQFYVSVSRGKESIRIYTDSRLGLQEAVGNTATRQSALELAGISKRDISSMNSDLPNKQWREVVQSRKAEGEARNHVKNLLDARKQDVSKKDADMSWRQYVEMRRGLVSADGRSRSKGHPQGTEKKSVNLANKRRSFLRPTEQKTSTKEKMQAGKEPNKKSPEVEKKPAPKAEKSEAKQTANPRQNRLVNAYKSAVSHFKEKTGWDKAAAPAKSANDNQQKKAAPAPTKTAVQGMAKPVQQTQAKPKALQQSNVSKVADHAAKQKAVEASKATQQAAKVAKEVKQKAATPPPPSPRK